MNASMIDVSQGLVMSTLLSVPRLLVFISVVPFFPGSVFTHTLRLGLSMGLGAPVAVGLYHEIGNGPRELELELVGLALKECGIGLLLGLAIAAPLWTIEAVGAFTDNQRGANAAQQVTPFAQADASVLGAALQQALIVLIFTSGAFALVYQLLLQSFVAWPVLQLVPDVSQFSVELTAGRFGEFLQKAVLYAAPMLAIVLLVDFAFALMGVFAPQLQTYFAALPVKSLSALAVLALYMFVLLSHGEGYFLDVLQRESALLEKRR